jgi:hypothetical protein
VQDLEQRVEEGEPEGVELDGWDGGDLGDDFERRCLEEVVPPVVEAGFEKVGEHGRVGNHGELRWR